MREVPAAMGFGVKHRFATSRTSHSNRTRDGQRYDRRHRDARADAARRHKPGDLCARCGHPLGPMGPQLHYDHDETGGYLGFSHRRCNLRAGAQKGNRTRLANALRDLPRLPSDW